MRKYNCKNCEYSTDDRGNFYKHNLSKRHLKKATNHSTEKTPFAKICRKFAGSLPGEIPKRYTCDDCQFETAHASSYSKHKKRCANKNNNVNAIIDDLKESKMKNKLIEQENEFLKREVENKKMIERMHNQHVLLLRQLIASSTKGSNGSVTSTLYEHYQNNPPLKEIEYMKLNSLIKPKSKLVDEMISCYKHNTLHEFLSRFILNIYKKKNYAEQSLFASDTSRLSYMIKETIYDNVSEWVPDKKGVKTKKLIIQPLTNHVIDLLEFCERRLVLKISDDISNTESLMRKKDDILHLKYYIEDGKLDDKINKFICAYLVMDKNMIKSFESQIKLPSLDD